MKKSMIASAIFAASPAIFAASPAFLPLLSEFNARFYCPAPKSPSGVASQKRIAKKRRNIKK